MDGNNKKQNYGIGLGLIGIIIVAGTIVLVLLNYFSIFPLSKIAPIIFGWLPSNSGDLSRKSDKSDLASQSSSNNAMVEEIVVRSDVDGYEIRLIDRLGLIEQLKKWKIFGNNFSGGYGVRGSTANMPVMKVTAVLTPIEQPVNQFVSSDLGVYMSSLTFAAPGEVTIFVYIADAILNDPKQRQQLGDIYDFEFLTTVYGLSSKALKKEDIKANQDVLNDYFIEKQKSKIRFFELRKI